MTTITLTRRALAPALAALALALAVASPASGGMSPEMWSSYVEVRTTLVKQVNSFMATYRSCSRREGFLTKAWGACVEPARVQKYVPAMLAMDRFLQGAIVNVKPTDQCYRAISSYVSRNVAARVAATHVVTHARLANVSRQQLASEADRFVVARNVATNARLQVNKLCSPLSERMTSAG
jgi:hypothetical protein